MGKIEKDRHYYDNSYKLNGKILFIDRVYIVDEYRFTDDTYEELAKIYRLLPEFIFDPTNICCWYGDKDKGDEIYLYVSFEPAGLQIVGNLPLYNFKTWEEEFHKQIIKVPFKVR